VARAPAVVSGPLALLVEDDPHSISLLSLYLEEAGLQIAEAHDGARGLEMASALHPVLIVLDVLLPEVDGWELLTRLKSDASLASIPVIITTVVDQRGKGLALGAVDYLVKPVRREELLTAVQRILPPVANGHGRALSIDE
jgi:CheY-like chemotaxis protein